MHVRGTQLPPETGNIMIYAYPTSPDPTVLILRSIRTAVRVIQAFFAPPRRPYTHPQHQPMPFFSASGD